MRASKIPPVACCLLGLLMATSSIAQEKKPSLDDRKAEAAAALFGGNADLWLNALLAAEESINSNIYLDRLSYYRLSTNQLEQLKTAAEREESDAKRLVLWHAIRQSRDMRSRDYLIKTLVEKSTVDMQVQFLDGLQNPTRFDIPILVALYNSQRPRKRLSTSPRARTANGKGNKNSEQKSGQTKSRSRSDPSPADPSQTDSEKDRSSEEDRSSDNEPDANIKDEKKLNGKDVAAKFGDLFHLPMKIVELTCHSDWKALTHMLGATYPKEEFTKEESTLWAEVQSYRSGEAMQAQEEMVYWLIKNGFDDRHRINAFREFATEGTFWQAKKTYAKIGWEFLDGLNDPNCRAEALRLAENWIDPTRFLGTHEPEVVRLGAIDAMQRNFFGLYHSSKGIPFEQTMAFYKPLLDALQNTDTSPDVRDSAKRLLEAIVQCEREYRK